MSPSPRQPPGTSDGGRFATVALSEADIRLDTVDLDSLTRCPACSGDGKRAPGADCFVCEGTGELVDDEDWSRQKTAEAACTVTCDDCAGDGITSDLAICVHCDGSGEVTDYSLAG